MIDEKAQFAISQYVDGTLSPEEAAQVEARLVLDAELRKLLQEYRRLDQMVKTATPVPEMDWDAMSLKISAAVAEDAQSAPLELVAAQPATWNWWRPVALAAGLLVCATAAVITWKMSIRDTQQPAGVVAQQPPRSEAYAIVNVFRTDKPAAGNGEVEVQIGRAPRNENVTPLAASENNVGPTYSSRATVLIAALPTMTADEDLMLLQ